MKKFLKGISLFFAFSLLAVSGGCDGTPEETTVTEDPAITAVTDENGTFVEVAGEYRVKDVMVGGEPLDVNKTYVLASHNYMLKNGGRIYMCQRVERFLELLEDIKNAKLIVSQIQFVTPSETGKPYLVLVEAYKGVNRQLKVLENYVNKG